MLTVRTYLDRSPVHGIGLFATEEIAAGALVWEFNPLIDLKFTPAQWRELRATLAPPSFANLVQYSYKEKGDIYLCLDNAQFMNHSRGGANVVQDRGCDRMLAGRRIESREELLCNYFAYSDPDDYHLQRMQSGPERETTWACRPGGNPAVPGGTS